MGRKKLILDSFVVAAVLCMLYAGTAFGFTAYTDESAFQAAIAGWDSEVLDFDSMTSGTTIADGGTIDGITFTYDFGGVNMMVSHAWDTTSPPNFLGTNDGDIFQDGDDFSLSFEPVNAIGMYFTSIDEMWDDDITLTVDTFSVGLDAATYLTLADGSMAFFLGIVDAQNAFTQADITTVGLGEFLYNVDDITTAAVPIPGAFWLLGSGLLGLIWNRRRH